MLIARVLTRRMEDSVIRSHIPTWNEYSTTRENASLIVISNLMWAHGWYGGNGLWRTGETKRPHFCPWQVKKVLRMGQHLCSALRDNYQNGWCWWPCYVWGRWEKQYRESLAKPCGKIRQVKSFYCVLWAWDPLKI